MDVLWFLELSGGKTTEKAIAVIKSGIDECMDEDFSCRLGEGGTEAGDVVEVEERSFSCMADFDGTVPAVREVLILLMIRGMRVRMQV